jgi:hypothetical protein
LKKHTAAAQWLAWDRLMKLINRHQKHSTRLNKGTCSAEGSEYTIATAGIQTTQVEQTTTSTRCPNDWR